MESRLDAVGKAIDLACRRAEETFLHVGAKEGKELVAYASRDPLRPFAGAAVGSRIEKIGVPRRKIDAGLVSMFCEDVERILETVLGQLIAFPSDDAKVRPDIQEGEPAPDGRSMRAIDRSALFRVPRTIRLGCSRNLRSPSNACGRSISRSGSPGSNR